MYTLALSQGQCYPNRTPDEDNHFQGINLKVHVYYYLHSHKDSKLHFAKLLLLAFGMFIVCVTMHYSGVIVQPPSPQAQGLPVGQVVVATVQVSANLIPLRGT